jgi:Histidyl-tRNA synthetase
MAVFLWQGDAPNKSRYDALVKYQTIKGTKDRLPSDAPTWRFILETARVVLERFGAGEIHTPVFEDTGVFHKAVGESSDIVRKEMYNFSDKGDRNLTLRQWYAPFSSMVSRANQVQQNSGRLNRCSVPKSRNVGVNGSFINLDSKLLDWLKPLPMPNVSMRVGA